MRQIYMGSDHRVPVGSFPSQGVLDSDCTGNVLGFRLTHDIEGLRTVRGGSTQYGVHIARTSDTIPLEPTAPNRAVGIRLCIDWDAP
jgi:hypothetical protein